MRECEAGAVHRDRLHHSCCSESGALRELLRRALDAVRGHDFAKGHKYDILCGEIMAALAYEVAWPDTARPAAGEELRWLVNSLWSSAPQGTPRDEAKWRQLSSLAEELSGLLGRARSHECDGPGCPVCRHFSPAADRPPG